MPYQMMYGSSPFVPGMGAQIYRGARRTEDFRRGVENRRLELADRELNLKAAQQAMTMKIEKLREKRLREQMEIQQGQFAEQLNLRKAELERRADEFAERMGLDRKRLGLAEARLDLDARREDRIVDRQERLDEQAITLDTRKILDMGGVEKPAMQPVEANIEDLQEVFFGEGVLMPKDKLTADWRAEYGRRKSKVEALTDPKKKADAQRNFRQWLVESGAYSGSFDALGQLAGEVAPIQVDDLSGKVEVQGLDGKTYLVDPQSERELKALREKEKIKQEFDPAGFEYPEPVKQEFRNMSADLGQILDRRDQAVREHGQLQEQIGKIRESVAIYERDLGKGKKLAPERQKEYDKKIQEIKALEEKQSKLGMDKYDAQIAALRLRRNAITNNPKVAEYFPQQWIHDIDWGKLDKLDWQLFRHALATAETDEGAKALRDFYKANRLTD